MIHSPLLTIDLLRKDAEKTNRPLTDKEWWTIRDEMNIAVCLFLRLQDSRALNNYPSIKEDVKNFLNSRDSI